MEEGDHLRGRQSVGGTLGSMEVSGTRRPSKPTWKRRGCAIVSKQPVRSVAEKCSGAEGARCRRSATKWRQRTCTSVMPRTEVPKAAGSLRRNEESSGSSGASAAFTGSESAPDWPWACCAHAFGSRAAWERL